MSTFATKLPVDLDTIKALLPKGSHVESVKWNAERGEMEIQWDNAELITPFSFPVDFSIAQLKAGELPEKTVIRERKPAPAPAPEAPEADPVVPTAKKKSVAKKNAAAAKQ